MIKVGVLTSSRADYGIYLPLLNAFKSSQDFELKLIVFGTHLSKFHGYTLTQILNDGFEPFAEIESMLIGDTPSAIASSYALTSLKFSDFWSNNQHAFDVVFALGDRFEMAAAVAVSIPFGIHFAHIHGGETTLGAIDNIYRHSISLASKYHFTSTAIFSKRIKSLLGEEIVHVYNVGSLSLENLDQIQLHSKDTFLQQWGIDLKKDTILVTVHPETVAYEKNQEYCEAITAAIKTLSIDYQIVITMPNADTSGTIFRRSFDVLSNEFDRVFVIENFGTQSYFSCMKYAKLLIGNTSSGIVEAASFGKYVINLGDRQKGRLSGENVIHAPFVSDEIVALSKKYTGQVFEGINPYFQPQPSFKIIKILKDIYASIS